MKNSQEGETEYFNETPQSIVEKKHLSKINANLNMNMINLLKHIKSKNSVNCVGFLDGNYEDPIDSFLIFAIIYKIFYDWGISEYIRIYRSKNIINIYEEKQTHKFTIQENKINSVKINDYLKKLDEDEILNIIHKNDEDYEKQILIDTNCHLKNLYNTLNNLINIFNIKIKSPKKHQTENTTETKYKLICNLKLEEPCCFMFYNFLNNEKIYFLENGSNFFLSITKNEIDNQIFDVDNVKFKKSCCCMSYNFSNNERFLFHAKESGFFLSIRKNGNSNQINMDTKSCLINEDNNKLKKKINSELFNLLRCLIEQNNSNYEHKKINSFLIFVIIYKFFNDLKIPEYIRIYNFKGIIQIYKEKITNKIGILEDKNNKLKLFHFIGKQDINFEKCDGKIEIDTQNHFSNVKSIIIDVFNIIGFHYIKDKNSKFIKMFCDSFFLNSHILDNKNYKNCFEITKKINQNFEFQNYINNNEQTLDEKFNFGKFESHKNNNRQKFLDKIKIFENRLKDNPEYYEENMENFEKSIERKPEKCKNRNLKKKLKKKEKKKSEIVMKEEKKSEKEEKEMEEEEKKSEKEEKEFEEEEKKSEKDEEEEDKYK